MMGIREVEFSAVPFDPFFNVNTPEDRAVAERLISGGRSGPIHPPG